VRSRKKKIGAKIARAGITRVRTSPRSCLHRSMGTASLRSPQQSSRDIIPIFTEISQSHMKQLILNADDFGLTRGVNEGIIRAHREGILTSTTLMACGPAFDHAVSLAKENPRLGIGCHLVLVGGSIVAPLEEVPTVGDRDGRMPESLGVFVTRLTSGNIRVTEIVRELRAQVQKIRAAGIEPTHLDTHKHTHAHPAVMEALGRVAQELGIKRVRKPMENLRDSWESSRGEGPGISRELLAATAARAAAPLFHSLARKYGLRSPDFFLGLAMTGQLGPEALRKMIGAVQDGTTEIMIHPGICDADLQKLGSRLQQQREAELAALLDPAVKSAIEEREIRLVTFRELN
jgi:hopanoid biosynthesis associated protein HpnK